MSLSVAADLMKGAAKARGAEDPKIICQTTQELSRRPCWTLISQKWDPLIEQLLKMSLRMFDCQELKISAEHLILPNGLSKEAIANLWCNAFNRAGIELPLSLES